MYKLGIVDPGYYIQVVTELNYIIWKIKAIHRSFSSCSLLVSVNTYLNPAYN